MDWQAARRRGQPTAAAPLMTRGVVRHDGGRVTDLDRGLLVGLACPYNRITTVRDDGREYDEAILPGCFAVSLRERPRVPITYGHNYKVFPLAVSSFFEDRDDGLWIGFEIEGGDQGERLLQMARLGWRPALSVGFNPVENRTTPARSRRAGRDLVERIRADLREVAVCVVGAYSDAGVRSRALV